MLINKENYPTHIKFNINETEYIILYIPHDSIENLGMWDNCPGYYYNDRGLCLEVIYSYHGISSELDRLIASLTLGINGQLEIDRTLVPNTGFQWNQYLGCTCENSEKDWIGRKYLCFSTANGPEAFIYTENQQIILEIIPTYPWLFGRKPKGIKKISFKQFLTTYKPHVKTVIPHEQALDWLVTAHKLDAIIERNEERRFITSNS